MPALVNWLWQGTAVAAVTLIALDRLRRLSATTRYRLLSVGLAGVLAIPLLSALLSAAARLPVGLDVQPVLEAPATLEVAALATPDWVPAALAAAWSIWFAIGLWRLFAALAHVRRLRRTSRPFPADRERRLVHWLGWRGRGRRAALVVSDRVPAVSVLGIGAPLIAVSPHVLAALDDEALDQVLLHEWAHVQRRDDLARVAQAVMRALAGFHPAVRALERRLEIEREVACDDRAANATGDPRRLAETLTRLASLAPLPGPAPAPALAPGALSASALTTRVGRLLDRRRNRSTGLSPAALSAGAAAIAGLTLALVGVRLEAVDDAGKGPVESPAPIRTMAREPAVLPATPTKIAGQPPSAGTAPARVPSPSGERPDPPAVPVTPADAARGAAPRAAPPHPLPLARLPRQPWAPPLDASSLAPAPAGFPGGEIRVEPGAGSDAAGDESPWSAAAGAGIAIGRGSQKAGTSTARFFTTLGRRIAGGK